LATEALLSDSGVLTLAKAALALEMGQGIRGCRLPNSLFRCKSCLGSKVSHLHPTGRVAH